MFAAKKYINTNIDEQLNIPNNDPSEAVKSAITNYIPNTSEISANLNFGELIFSTTAVTFHVSSLAQLPQHKLQTAVANVCYIGVGGKFQFLTFKLSDYNGSKYKQQSFNEYLHYIT